MSQLALLAASIDTGSIENHGLPIQVATAGSSCQGAVAIQATTEAIWLSSFSGSLRICHAYTDTHRHTHTST